MCRTISNEHVDMIARYLTSYNIKLMLHSYLAQNIPGTLGYLSNKNTLAVLRNPDNMNLQICLAMCTYSITSHSDRYKTCLA